MTPTRKPKPIDAPRVKAARAKLDELVTRYPHLTSPESQERLARHLETDAPPKDEDDGSEEDDGQ
jgi:hypothetical protein